MILVLMQEKGCSSSGGAMLVQKRAIAPLMFFKIFSILGY